MQARQNQIELLETDVKSGFMKVGENLEALDNAYCNPTHSSIRNFKNKLLGVKSKLEKLVRKKRQVQELKETKRLHICWGSKKLFKAQYNLEENGYSNHEEWLEDWRKKRGVSGTYQIREGSLLGTNRRNT